MIEKSRRLISEYSKRYRRVYVLFSGGKDSLVVLLLTLNTIGSENFSVLYTRLPGNTAPECDEYVKSICNELGVELVVAYRKINFWEQMKRRGFPYIKGMRWCAQRYKYDVWKKLGGKNTLFISGVKRKDRIIRSKMMKEYQYVELWDSYAIAPISFWSKTQVIDFIRKHNVPLNPLYQEIGHSGNCLFCPFLDKKSFMRTMRRYWNVATMLYEIVLNPPESDVNRKKLKGLVKGSQYVYEWLCKNLEILEKESQYEKFLYEGYDQCPSELYELLYWGFIYECLNGKGEIVTEKW